MIQYYTSVQSEIMFLFMLFHSSASFLLNLADTFNAIDLNILILCGQYWFGFASSALLLLLSSFLSDFFQTFTISNSKLQPGKLEYGFFKGAFWGLYSIHLPPLSVISIYPGRPIPSHFNTYDA